MRIRMTRRRLWVLVALLPFFWGCRDNLVELQHHGEPEAAGVADGGVPVSVVLGDGSGPSRTIAPAHITQANLRNASFILTGTSDRGGSVNVPTFRLSNGVGTCNLTPGNWQLELVYGTANVQMLRGVGTLVVEDKPTSVAITLSPMPGGTGTVNVEFTVPSSVLKQIDPVSDADPTRRITVALYDAIGGVMQHTSRVFTTTNLASDYTFTYTAPAVAAGRYVLKLEAPYTVMNASTKGLFVDYGLGWSDILYVEAGRESRATVTIPQTVLSVPGKPYRRTTRIAGGSSGTAGFAQDKSFNHWGDTLWLYGADFNGPGNGNDGDGNEWLVVSWDSVYDADYYEVELLVHPFTKNARNPTDPGGKFPWIVTTDAEWDVLKEREFTYNTTKSKPFHLRFSGGEDDPDYYRSRVYEITCLNSGNSNAVEKFLVCADKPTARSMFTAGGYSTGYVNSTYTIRSAARDCFDNYGNYTYGTMNLGKVGLEADCSVLPVLLPAFTPQMALVFRVRAVNRFGYSDWVYWKGGKW